VTAGDCSRSTVAVLFSAGKDSARAAFLLDPGVADEVVADGTRRDDRVPTLDRSFAQSLEDRHGVSYVRPLLGYGATLSMSWSSVSWLSRPAPASGWRLPTTRRNCGR